MFTGIVEATGLIRSLKNGVLVLDAPASFGLEPFKIGESIAVNGCCLTVVAEGDGLSFDLSPETLHRTSFCDLIPGKRVNLERAMKPSDRFGGHIVQGHVDATGRFLGSEVNGNSTVIRVQSPLEFDRYLIDKGSITVDGISLTVVNPVEGAFEVWIIPQTLKETNLGERTPGDLVNLEFDVVAKYVEKLVGSRESGIGSRESGVRVGNT